MVKVDPSDARKAYNGQIKWANMLRPNYCKKGRDLAGVAFPIFFARRVCNVTKDEILQKLKVLGAKVSYPTLNRYVSDGLVTKPVTESRGRVEGRVSHYPAHALFEAYAAWNMMKGVGRFSKTQIQQVCSRGEKYRDRYDMDDEFVFRVWLMGVFVGFLVWKFDENEDFVLSLLRDRKRLLENNSTIEGNPETKWVEEMAGYGEDSDEISNRMLAAWGKSDFKPRYLIRVTVDHLRVYKQVNNAWNMISKDQIKTILSTV